RLAPLRFALQVTREGLPAVHRLIVLPSTAFSGIPVEALLDPGDPWVVSYVPSASVLAYLRKQPSVPNDGSLLALGDPVFQPRVAPDKPITPPDHGLLIAGVEAGSNADSHALKSGDVLLSYNGVN